MMCWKHFIAVPLAIMGIFSTLSAQTGVITPQARSTWVLPKNISGIVTVETGPETAPQHLGFEACAAKLFNAPYRHDTTERASDNLKGSTEVSRGAVIIGHGSPGIVCTGGGDQCPGSNQSIAFDDQAVWKLWLEKIPASAPTLTILACDAANGPLGTRLMTDLAQVLKRPVRAPDGIIFCHPDGIEFYDAQWVEATPKRTPTLHARGYTTPVWTKANFVIRNRMITVPIDAVTVVQLRHRAYRQREFVNVSTRTRNFRTYVSLIDFAHPFEDPGIPAGIVTDRIRVQVHVRGLKEPVEKNFVVFNEELLEDLAYPEVFYRADKRLANYFARR